MLRTQFIAYSFTIICSILAGQLAAQGWERPFGGTQGDGFYDVINTVDQGYLAVGHRQVSQSPLHHDLYLVKVDAGGFEDWNTQFTDTLYSYFGKSIQVTADGGYIVGGTAVAENIPRGFLAKTTQVGEVEWVILTEQDSVWGRKVLALDDGTFLLAGSAFQLSPNGLDYDFFTFHVNAQGNQILSEHTYGGDFFDDCHDALLTPEGDLILAGLTNSYGAGHYDAYLVKVNMAGDTVWTKTYGTSNAEIAYAVSATQDGNLVITGQEESTAIHSEDIFLAKIDPEGELIWWKSYPKAGIDLASDVKAADMGGFIITGYTQASPDADRQAFLLKTYVNGDEHWKRHYGGSSHDGGIAVAESTQSGFVMAGYSNSYGSGGADGYLVKTDQTGLSNACFIVGNVHSNSNTSCIPETFGDYVPNMIVEIAGATTYFGTTNAAGDYVVPVLPGDYNVRMVNPSPLWSLCEDSVQVQVAQPFDTAFVDFFHASRYPLPLHAG